jgi:putative transposase
VDTEDYLVRCLTYIDLNMVRAGVVSHPVQWPACGYRERQEPAKRYGILDVPVLMALLGLRDLSALQRARRNWADEALRAGRPQREGRWSEGLAGGHEQFMEGVKAQLGISARYRGMEACWHGQGCMLKEPAVAYSADFDPENATLSREKALISESR